MRDRLIELIEVARSEYYDYSDEIHKIGLTVEESSAEYIADHLIANGVIVPPCKVGDKVYIIDDIEFEEPYVLDVVVTAIGYDINGFWITMSLPLGMKQSAHVGEYSFGKTVFLTREEAEQALKGGGEE